MTPPDPSPRRRERVKQILTDSYPRVAKENRKPLPKGVLAELRGDSGAEPASPQRGRSFLQRLGALLRGPQALGLGAAALLVLVGVFALLPSTKEGGGGGDPSRSGGTTAPSAPLVVLHGLPDSQLEVLRTSPLFRPEQLAELPAGQELSAYVEEKRRPQLIVVDGTKGTIMVPFDPGTRPAIEFDAESDLESVLIDLLSELAKEEPE